MKEKYSSPKILKANNFEISIMGKDVSIIPLLGPIVAVAEIAAAGYAAGKALNKAIGIINVGNHISALTSRKDFSEVIA